MRSGRVLELLRQMAPGLTALVAALVDLLPVPASGTPAPLLTVCVVCFWTLNDPDRLAALPLFLVGLLLDGAGGTPLGLTSLTLLLVRSALLGTRGLLLTQPVLVMAGGLVIAVASFGALRWLLFALWEGRPYPLQPSLVEAFLTLAAYPLIGWPLLRLHHALRPRPYAAGG